MKQYDIILWGATSFAGQIAAKYLLKTYGVNQSVKWAIAGRSINKLETLKKDLHAINPQSKELDILIGDSDDYDSLINIVNKTKVVVSTVGPFLIYGQKLVQACVETGTDYCDLTGEAIFIRKMQDLYWEKAKQTGSRIIHCCGVDSIPSDLGVYFTNKKAIEQYNQPIVSANCYIKAFKGAFSGGTVASIINMLDTVKNDESLTKMLSSPYALCPPNARSGIRQPSSATCSYSTEVKQWQSPFLMASINSKVVHNSNALLDYLYTKNFIYTETALNKSRLQAIFNSLSLASLFIALKFKPTRWILTKFLPKPGEGPSLEEQENGFFKYNIYGKTSSGQTVVTEVTGDKDPGYGSSAQMLVESAISLAATSKEKLAGGFWTPASALSDYLYERLAKHAGVKFI